MAEDKRQYPEMEQLRADLKQGSVGKLYLFQGEERFLLHFYLGQLREALVAPGTEEFNLRRMEGKGLTLRELEEAIDAYPAFADRTLVEIRDWDIFSLPEADRAALDQILGQVPDYLCLVLVYDTLAFSPDKRLKHNQALLKKFRQVEFGLQPKEKLIRWIMNRAAKCGARADREMAEYLAFVCGDSMTRLDPELQKLGSYCDGAITREAVDELVTPVVEAVAWKLTDALTGKRYGEAMETLGKLITLQEPAHKLIAAISSELRKLLTVKLWLEEKKPQAELKSVCGFRYDFQMQKTLSAAKQRPLHWCVESVRLCSETAYKLNTEKADYEDLLRQLVAELALL